MAQTPHDITTALGLVEGGETPSLERPVFFVASQLGRSWPEIEPPDGSMALGDIPSSRLHLIENIWIVSTYLRLKESGANVRISDRLQPEHINVCTDERLLHDHASGSAFIVVVQADRGYGGWGDFTVCQSPALARGPDCCLIDHWPQPGLISRDADRGDRIERVGYQGFAGNLASGYRDPAFINGLADLGVQWDSREDPSQWHDYSDLDLCLAVRDIPEIWIRTKPSTKLVHAWLTGCPGLLGVEPAFRYWGEPGEDYLEIRSPEEAVEWVRRLKDDPDQYRAIRERGFVKGARHGEPSVLAQWQAMLAGPVQEAFGDWIARPKHGRGRERMVTAISRRCFYLRAKGLRATTLGAVRRISNRAS